MQQNCDERSAQAPQVRSVLSQGKIFGFALPLPGPSPSCESPCPQPTSSLLAGRNFGAHHWFERNDLHKSPRKREVKQDHAVLWIINKTGALLNWTCGHMTSRQRLLLCFLIQQSVVKPFGRRLLGSPLATRDVHATCEVCKASRHPRPNMKRHRWSTIFHDFSKSNIFSFVWARTKHILAAKTWKAYPLQPSTRTKNIFVKLPSNGSISLITPHGQYAYTRCIAMCVMCFSRSSAGWRCGSMRIQCIVPVSHHLFVIWQRYCL